MTSPGLLSSQAEELSLLGRSTQSMKHVVQFYEDDEFLADAVSRFASDGIAAGEAVLLIALEAQRREVARRLEAMGCEVGPLVGQGRLVFLDAAETLSQLLVDGHPEWDRFRAIIGGVIEKAKADTRQARVRAYGAMVDLLWKQGKPDAALALERMWNQLGASHGFGLLCAYAFANFYKVSDARGFAEVCSTHGHVVPTERFSALEDPEDREREVSRLHQRAQALQDELERRKELEQTLRSIIERDSRLHRETEAARGELELLYRLTESVSSADSLEETFDAALDGLTAILKTDRLSILLFDEDGVMRFKASRGLSEAYKRAVEGHSPWKRGDEDFRPIWVDDVEASAAMEPYRAIFRQEGIRALGFIPIVRSSELLGKFMLYYSRPHAFTEREEQLAIAAARNAAVAVARRHSIIENERLYEEAERARAEEQKQRAQLTAILEQLPAGVMIAEAPSGRITFSNRNAEEIFRGPVTVAETIADYSQFKAWHADGRSYLAEEFPLPRAIMGETVRDVEVYFERADGSRGVVRANAAPVRAPSGEIIAAVTAYYDITAMKAAQQDRERTRDMFIGILGHDLRNPVTAVTMAAQLLLKADDLPERHSRTAARIARSADRMGHIIADVLDFAHGRLGGGIPVTCVPCDMDEIVRRVFEETEIAHPTRKILLETHESQPGCWDSARIAQALSNLLGNAVLHGSDPICVSIRGDVHEVVVEVRNGGAPIPAEVLPTIFDPFCGRDRRDGLGLGLFIVSEIVRAHAGRIAVTSNQLEGTAFTMHLPRH